MKPSSTEGLSLCGGGGGETKSRRGNMILVLLMVFTVLSVPNLYFGTMVSHGKCKKSRTSTTPEETKQDTRPLVAIVVCTKSLPNWGQNISSITGLHTLLIPSIERTVTLYESRHFRVEFVIGFDKGDVFWENELNRKALRNDTVLPLNFLSIAKSPDRPYHIRFNQACRAAYEYGADYIVRVNDDTEFLSSTWIRKGIAELAKFDPPNVGVVGPIFKGGNPKILTHDFVHRTHLDIFNDYYPDEFDNWWIDDWITVVYQRTGRCNKMEDWRVEHHSMLNGGSHSRYQITKTQNKMLKSTVQRGMKSIDTFIHNRTGEAIQPVLGTDKIDNVWGPMARFHASTPAGVN